MVWPLEKTKLWTPCDKNLVLCMGHKPLIGLIENKCIKDIANPHLQSLVERTLRCNLKGKHVLGLENCVTDTLSRYPWSKTEDDGEMANISDVG